MQTIVIDGRAFAIELAGSGRPLAVQVTDANGGAERVSLRPWPCARHLASLRRHLYVDGQDLMLDSAGYADDVLDSAEVPPALWPELRPLAMWWAHGAPSPDDDAVSAASGRVLLGPGLWAQLRPWTWGERLAAQQASLGQSDGTKGLGGGGDGGFDPVGYLESMVAASVVRLEADAGEAPGMDELDAAATRRLLAAVSALNHRDADVLDTLPPALAAATLRLCSAMSWTPGQVLAMSAPEVERLLALLDRVDARVDGAGHGVTPRQGRSDAAPRPAVAARRPRIAEHPDAVVIVFGEGGEA